ncbi:MAG: hypothetical protein E7330_00860 [Clostridiales bacterium]|nr:hypothetical protein [Clostridiales bacterium]
MMLRLKKRLAAVVVFLLAAALCGSTLAAEITGSSTPESLSASGNVTFTFNIKNDGEAEMTDIRILYNGSDFFSTADAVIASGESKSFTSSPLTVPDALIGQPITFDVTWNENGESRSASPTVTVQKSGGVLGDDPLAQLPQSVSVTAARTVSASQASTGEVITLTYTVTNSGTVAVTGVSITDKEIGGREPMVKDITVEPGIPYVYTHEYKMGSSTVTSAPVITYKMPDGTESKITVSEKVLGMVKSRLDTEVVPGVPTADGQSFTLTLTNNGNQRISKISVKDDLGVVVAEGFQLAIGESKTLTHTVSTAEARNVVFYIEGVDGIDQQYSDKTESYPVRVYIDPSLVGIDFSAAVAEPLNSAGSITVNFTVANTGSLTMQNMVLTEQEYGEIHRLESFAPGTENINAKVHVGTPRDLVFTLTLFDSSQNEYTYTAHITADYVGTVSEQEPEAPSVEEEGDLIAEVGSSVSSALRTVLIVLGILTVIALIALIILSSLEKKERARLARRRAIRERKLREQAMEEANALARGANRAVPPAGGTTQRIPPVNPTPRTPTDGGSTTRVPRTRK